ncbi:AbrB/MazE/SpoVT family DNA-binding domain-containing protein [Limosilactobacillus fermentum]|nr:AbrB/MazE/SpoVT family DNA-binding domain-containing protein [Limosilactobacillus fermentum]
MKNYRVEVPKVARDQLEIKDGEPLAMWVEGNQLVIRPLRLADSLPQIKLWWYFGPALVLTLLFYADMINQGYHLLPLVGVIRWRRLALPCYFKRVIGLCHHLH